MYHLTQVLGNWQHELEYFVPNYERNYTFELPKKEKIGTTLLLPTVQKNA